MLFVDPALFHRHLGLPRGTEPDPATASLADAARDWYREHGDPWAHVSIREIRSIEGDRVLLEGDILTSAVLADGFRAADARQLAMGGVSAGAAVDREIDARFQSDRPDEAMILNAFAVAVAEHLRARQGRRLRRQFTKSNRTVLPHYSPGYDGWELDDQATLFAALEEQGPLRLLPSGGLRPARSALAVFGITAEAVAPKPARRILAPLPGQRNRRGPRRTGRPSLCLPGKDSREMEPRATDDRRAPRQRNRRPLSFRRHHVQQLGVAAGVRLFHRVERRERGKTSNRQFRLPPRGMQRRLPLDVRLSGRSRSYGRCIRRAVSRRQEPRRSDRTAGRDQPVGLPMSAIQPQSQMEHRPTDTPLPPPNRAARVRGCEKNVSPSNFAPAYTIHSIDTEPRAQATGQEQATATRFSTASPRTVSHFTVFRLLEPMRPRPVAFAPGSVSAF